MKYRRHPAEVTADRLKDHYERFDKFDGRELAALVDGLRLLWVAVARYVQADRLQAWGRIVRSRRLDLMLSQGRLARRLGVAQATVQRWEAGTTVPADEHLELLVDVLGPRVRVDLYD